MVQGASPGVCPPYFEGCAPILNSAHQWLTSQFGMNHLRVPMAIALIPIEVGLIALALNRTKLAWSMLFAVFLIRAVPTLLFQFPILNFDFYDIVILFALLFTRNKFFASKVVFVFTYFLCSTIKFDSGWISGDYFLTLKEGLPFAGNSETLTILATNTVIVIQLIAGFALLSGNARIRLVAFVSFSLFHIYSAAVVGLRFPLSTIPLLIVLFAFDLQRKVDVPLKMAMKQITGDLNPDKSIQGGHNVLLVVCLALFAIQVGKVMVPGNEKLSGELSTSGFYMFDANHQCASVIEEVGEDRKFKFVSQAANVYAQNRCTVWESLYDARQQYCVEPPPGAPKPQLAFTFLSSVNGSPFYEIVSRVNLCQVKYDYFGRNSWINLNVGSMKSFHAYQNTYGNRFGSSSMLSFDAERDGLYDEQLAIDLGLKPIQPSDRPTLGLFNEVLTYVYWAIFLILSGLFFRELFQKTSARVEVTPLQDDNLRA
tara:strand:+ start:1937 stop:3388 length:1452 start_codon:yes stop_codon:yes gene_type:complete